MCGRGGGVRGESGGAGGTLRVYERSDDSREYYKMAKVFKIEGNLCRITNLAMSPSEDNLTCTLENHQVYVLGLSNTDILKEDVMNFDLLATAFDLLTRLGALKHVDDVLDDEVRALTKRLAKEL